jgi:hypothetical protein
MSREATNDAHRRFVHAWQIKDADARGRVIVNGRYVQRSTTSPTSAMYFTSTGFAIFSIFAHKSQMM